MTNPEKGEISRRHFNRLVFGGLCLFPITTFGVLVWNIRDNQQEEEERRLAFEEELRGYPYEVRVPRAVVVPGYVSAFPPVVEASRAKIKVDIFLTRNMPATERDASGVDRLILTEVMRFDPFRRVALERWGRYVIVNPIDVGIIDRK